MYEERICQRSWHYNASKLTGNVSNQVVLSQSCNVRRETAKLSPCQRAKLDLRHLSGKLSTGFCQLSRLGVCRISRRLAIRLGFRRRERVILRRQAMGVQAVENHPNCQDVGVRLVHQRANPEPAPYPGDRRWNARSGKQRQSTRQSRCRGSLPSPGPPPWWRVRLIRSFGQQSRRSSPRGLLRIPGIGASRSGLSVRKNGALGPE